MNQKEIAIFIFLEHKTETKQQIYETQIYLN
jgi:hypothetical protein